MGSPHGDPGLRTVTIPTQPGPDAHPTDHLTGGAPVGVEHSVTPPVVEATGRGHLATVGAEVVTRSPRLARLAELALGTIGFASETARVTRQAGEYVGAARQSGADVVGMARHGVAAVGPKIREASHGLVVDEVAHDAMLTSDRAAELRAEYATRRDEERAAHDRGEIPGALHHLRTALAGLRAGSATRKQRRAVDALAAEAHTHEEHKRATAQRTGRAAAHAQAIKTRVAAVGTRTQPEA